MGRLAFCVVTLLAAVAPVAVRAQFIAVPSAPGYAINSPVSNSPLQQQILRNYRSELRQTQRELAVRNPSGLSREQLDVTRQLNTLNSTLNPAPHSPVTTPGAPEPAPFR